MPRSHFKAYAVAVVLSYGIAAVPQPQKLLSAPTGAPDPKPRKRSLRVLPSCLMDLRPVAQRSLLPAVVSADGFVELGLGPATVLRVSRVPVEFSCSGFPLKVKRTQ